MSLPDEIRAATSEVDVAELAAGRAAAEATERAAEAAREEVRQAASVLLGRIRWMRQAGITFRGARDLYQILGYLRELTTWDHRDRYARGGLAGRIVDVMPDATWRGDPAFEVVEDKSGKADTEFERAFVALSTRLSLASLFPKADKLARLSTFSVVLIGAPGDFQDELPRGNGDASQILYAQAFGGGGGPGGSPRSRALAMDADASVFEFETDATNWRFGKPKSYWLRRTDVSAPMLQRPVHWSRVIHVAEGLL